MVQTFKNALPPIYEHLLPSFFDNEIPPENLATCSDCVMLGSCSSNRQDVVHQFSKETKCCTYFPTIPNYLIGGLFNDKDKLFDFGKAAVNKVIEGKTGINPLGVHSHPLHNAKFKGNQAGFGRDESMLCPYYNKEIGGCSVWKYRINTCLTWFCKHHGGEVGRLFWVAFDYYLFHLQNCLELYTLKELGMTPIVESYLPDEKMLEGLPDDPKEYTKKWGKWEGKEHAFYERSFQLVNKLTAADLESLLGDKGVELMQTLEVAYDKYMNLPELMSVNPEVLELPDDNQDVRIEIEQIGLSFSLPPIVFELFDGQRKIEEIKSILLEEHKLYLKDEIVRCLYHFNYLKSSS